MTNHKALLIPFDENKPVEEIEFDADRPDTWAKLVCPAGGSGAIDFKSFPTQGTQLMFDDMGLYDQPNNTNPRAMKLWAHLSGISLDNFRQPLVGDFVVLGLDRYQGETEDVPGHVRYFFGEEGVAQDA
jgi:hypothetical protein